MSERAKLEAEQHALEEAKRKFEADAKSVTEAYAKKKAELAQLHQKMQQAKQKFVSEKEEFEKIRAAFLQDPNAKKFYEANKGKGSSLDDSAKLEPEKLKIEQEKVKLEQEKAKLAQEKLNIEQERKSLEELRKQIEKDQQEITKYKEDRKRRKEEKDKEKKSSTEGAKIPKHKKSLTESSNQLTPPSTTSTSMSLSVPNSSPKKKAEKRLSRRSLFIAQDNDRRPRPVSMQIHAQFRKSVTEKSSYQPHLRAPSRADPIDDLRELRKQLAAHDARQQQLQQHPTLQKATSKKPGKSSDVVKKTYTQPKFVLPTTLPPNFKLPPSRPVYELKKENLPFVPPQVFEFGMISNLNLSQNYLKTIPDQIEKLEKLVELDVSHNHLTKIPTTLASCSNLETILLGGNPGIILPANFASMSELTTVSVQRNRLDHLSDEICKLPHLQHLDISFNHISKLPSAIGALGGLITLVAGCNSISELPKEIGELKQLTYLDLKKNKLSKLPSEIGSLGNLEEFYISENRISTLPQQMRLSNLPALFKFDAYKNEISEIHGKFFEGATHCALEELLLGRNKLTNLPEGLWDVTHLAILDLKCNNLSNLSPLIGNMFQISVLDLGYNKLTSIPAEISRCGTLVTLNLFGNLIKSLPDTFSHFIHLRQLYLGYNQLQNLNVLDDCNFEDLEELFLNGNPLGSIPTSLCKQTPVLRYLYLNNLKLTTVPSYIETLPCLEQLDLSHNLLTTLPVEIFQLRQLYSLDVSHNKLVSTNITTTSGDSETWDTSNWVHECAVEILDISFNSLTQLPVACKDLMSRGTSVLYYGNPFSLKETPTSIYSTGWSEMVGRRPTQEDSLCVAGKLSDNTHLYALFDGHAGRGAADYAARHFPKVLAQKISQEKDLLKALSDSFIELNDNFRKFSASSKDPAIKHCGATGVAALLSGSEIFVANVGDARAVMYLGGDPITNNTNKSLDLCSTSNVVRISEDHKPDDEEDRIRLAGGYVVDSRVNGFLGVSRSIGDFYIDPIICEPSTTKYKVPSSNDAFIILGCDGVWDELSDTEACSIVHKFSSQNDNLHSLSSVVRDFAYFLGSDDNISAMVVKLKK